MATAELYQLVALSLDIDPGALRAYRGPFGVALHLPAGEQGRQMGERLQIARNHVEAGGIQVADWNGFERGGSESLLVKLRLTDFASWAGKLGFSLPDEFPKPVITHKVRAVPSFTAGNKVVIGHGRSMLWRELKDFIRDRCLLEPDEYSLVATAGYSRQERLQQMLDSAGFAFLVMTAEDEQPDGTVRARENVVHEVGLFQGRLGFKRAIVLMEEGCVEFSNIAGLEQIRFPTGDIKARFEDVRQVLEREKVIVSARVGPTSPLAP